MRVIVRVDASKLFCFRVGQDSKSCACFCTLGRHSQSDWPHAGINNYKINMKVALFKWQIHLWIPMSRHHSNDRWMWHNYVPLSEEVGTCWFTSVPSVCPLSTCLCILSVCMSYSFVSFCPALCIVQAATHTRRWPNAGLMLAHRLRRWANISRVLGYCVVFGATLNVGQRHRLHANINPALVQSIVPVLPACRYRQHADTASMKYWQGLNRYWPAPATLAQHLTDIGSVSACNRRQQ